MVQRTRGRRVGFAVILTVLTAGVSYAVPTAGFTCITNDSTMDAAIGETQLYVEILPHTTGVEFHFMNTGPEACSITDVYFDDGSLLGIADIIDGDGVAFTQLANPHDLPGGNSITPHFDVTQGFSADSDAPVQPNGVNPGEDLSIVFDLQDTRTYGDVLDELMSGELRIGIHVQGFCGGGSESFINDPPIPAPGAILLGTMGIACVGWVRRRGLLGR